MEDVLLEWLKYLVRWLHVIAGVAWIGASFYFVHLNNHLRPPDDEKQKKKGIDGELWAIHGGGIYFIERYGLAPEQMPKKLHWFKWEAYMTWISGFSLLVLVYYLDGSVIDQNKLALTKSQAAGIGIGTLLLGWFIYDLLCKSPLGEHDFWFAMVGFAIATAFSWGLVQVFENKAAYLHVGAMLGTIMAANVFRVIIPNQRETVRAMTAKTEPDATIARKAKQRSLHNNYITLPVLFIMVSGHFEYTFGNPHLNWIILAAISFLGAGIRHWFNLRGRGQKNYYILPAAALGILAVAIVSAPPDRSGGEKVGFEQVQQIIDKHCISCHSKNPTDPVWKVAPLGVTYDTPEEIKAKVEKIKVRAVNSVSMPFGNKTNMTREERELLGRWIDQGASISN